MENQTAQNDLRYLEAKRKVKKRKAFFLHLFLFIIINSGLIPFKLIGDQSVEFNEFFTIGVWGFFLLLQGLNTFFPNFFLGSNWEEKKIREIMTKNK